MLSISRKYPRYLHYQQKKGFFWRKDSLERLNSPQDPRQSLKGKRIK
jgi:hypothetical protein